MMVQAQEEMSEDEAVNEEMDDKLVRAAATASSLEAKQDNGVNIPRSREDILKLNELMDLCTNLQNRVLALEATKTTQAHEIDSLKRRVKKLDKKQRSRTHKLKRLYKVGLLARVESSNDKGLGEEDASKHGRIIDDLNADEDITLVNDQEMFDADKDLQGEEVVVEQEVVADKELIVDATHVSATVTTVTIDDITLAKALKALKTLKPNIRGIVIKDHEEPSESRTTTIISSKKSQNKEKRRKFFAAKRAKEKMNRPPIKAQQRVDTFVNYTTELVEESSKKVKEEITQEESSKRAGDELEQETAKKQKIVDDKETTNLKQLVKIFPEEDIAIDAIPLAVKTPIVD
nr:hypothetical protein [Tanacetum cinerariifolium]